MKAASDNLTPCVLELGGKDCLVLLDDCDVSRALHIAMRGTFQNSGQNCAGVERLMVHESIADTVVNGLVERIDKMRLGAPLDQHDVDMGAMTMGAPVRLTTGRQPLERMDSCRVFLLHSICRR